MENSNSHAMEDRCYVTVMTVFATILFFVVFPIFVCVGLCSALAIYAYRGSQYVGWCKPDDCLNSLDWAFSEWDYYGLGGQQTGVRVFGIEVAYAGLLH